MLREILKPIENELNIVNNTVEKEMFIRAGHIGTYAHLEFSYFDRVIRPALVILSSRIYGCAGEKTLSLACVFQFTHMASIVHKTIPEKDTDYIREDSDPRDGSQFPVLAGDYLYGKFFSYLHNAGMINFLGPVAEIICGIHEGGILKNKIKGKNPASEAYCEVVRKETAELFAGCAAMGARLAGASEYDQESMKLFGINIGMASGLMESGAAAKYTAAYLKEAAAVLRYVPDLAERAILEQIVNSISSHNISSRRMVI
ncbi:polyprenyl synthetase family protein [Pelotomaculum propionicicum]|uniref:polyprenyl synthetase family protein n=1 Tax=Pelotomaculum propionicicum TaxID=258475 RepID=UPI003B79D4F3